MNKRNSFLPSFLKLPPAGTQKLRSMHWHTKAALLCQSMLQECFPRRAFCNVAWWPMTHVLRLQGLQPTCQ